VASDLLEAESPVKLDRSGVAGVREEPGLGGALADPVEASLSQRRADAAAAFVPTDEDACEVVAARNGVRRRVRRRLEQAGATVADNRAEALRDDEFVVVVLEVTEQGGAPG